MRVRKATLVMLASMYTITSTTHPVGHLTTHDDADQNTGEISQIQPRAPRTDVEVGQCWTRRRSLFAKCKCTNPKVGCTATNCRSGPRCPPKESYSEAKYFTFTCRTPGKSNLAIKREIKSIVHVPSWVANMLATHHSLQQLDEQEVATRIIGLGFEIERGYCHLPMDARKDSGLRGEFWYVEDTAQYSQPLEPPIWNVLEYLFHHYHPSEAETLSKIKWDNGRYGMPASPAPVPNPNHPGAPVARIPVDSLLNSVPNPNHPGAPVARISVGSLLSGPHPNHPNHPG